MFFSITTDLGNLRMYIDTVATVEVKICERPSESYPVYIVFYITVLEKSYKSTYKVKVFEDVTWHKLMVSHDWKEHLKYPPSVFTVQDDFLDKSLIELEENKV